ncbi:MAG: TraR/DksA C4-type zinc finger protein [Woeseiaceae bacterium]
MRDKLLKLRAELEAEVETAEGSAAIVELDQSKVGRLSRMDAMQAQAMAQASGQRRDATLRGITAALKRLDDGEYGFCQACDEPINPKRLEFDPTVLLCIGCASKSENH